MIFDDAFKMVLCNFTLMKCPFTGRALIYQLRQLIAVRNEIHTSNAATSIGNYVKFHSKEFSDWIKV